MKNQMKKLIDEIVGESFSIGNITPEKLKFGMYICDKDVESLKVIQDSSLKLQKLIENLDENILPRPVIRAGNGKLIKDHASKDFYMKLQEKIFESMWELFYSSVLLINKKNLAEEIADIITVCISYLNALGYDEEKRSEIFRKVNEKNEKRGYFKENE